MHGSLEKPSNIKGVLAVSLRKILDGILYVLITGCQWKILLEEYGSLLIIGDFSSG